MLQHPSLPEQISRVGNRMYTYNHPKRRICEMQARYSLIDPILRSIGWDLEDSDSVQYEKSLGPDTRRKRDYTLLVNNKAVAVIESKNWGRLSSKKKKKNPITLPGCEQLQKYCRGSGIKILILTDGGFWVVYGMSRDSKPEVIFTVDYNHEAAGLTSTENKERAIKNFSRLSPGNISQL
jgi:predicted type IV restriction endonuclease